jgi:hypothetical protein
MDVVKDVLDLTSRRHLAQLLAGRGGLELHDDINPFKPVANDIRGEFVFGEARDTEYESQRGEG